MKVLLCSANRSSPLASVLPGLQECSCLLPFLDREAPGGGLQLFVISGFSASLLVSLILPISLEISLSSLFKSLQLNYLSEVLFPAGTLMHPLKAPSSSVI